MDKIGFVLTTLTATFLHVEPRGDARWRAAPFRGLARWWYRAALGASLQPDQVRAREEEVFGAAEHPSLVSVRVFPLGAVNSTTARVNPGPPGQPKYQAPSGSLPVGAQARVELRSVKGFIRNETALHQAYASLWLALHLGGIGQRSRRGAGSVQMSELFGVDVPQPVQARDRAGYRDGLQDGLGHVRRILGTATSRALGPVAEFPVLHRRCANVWIASTPLPPGAREAHARLAVMQARRNLASHNPGPQRARKPEREFGGVRPRLASPLWVRIASIAEDSALLVITLLRHAGAGSGAEWTNVENFVNAIDPNALPVDLGG